MASCVCIAVVYIVAYTCYAGWLAELNYYLTFDVAQYVGITNTKKKK